MRVQEVFEDLCQRNRSSDPGSVQEMTNSSLSVSLLCFINFKFDIFPKF